MSCEKELKAQIKNLETVLNSGANSHSEDGRSTSFDLQETKQRLRVLRHDLAKVQGKRKRRPTILQVDMSAHD